MMKLHSHSWPGCCWVVQWNGPKPRQAFMNDITYRKLVNQLPFLRTVYQNIIHRRDQKDLVCLAYIYRVISEFDICSESDFRVRES